MIKGDDLRVGVKRPALSTCNSLAANTHPESNLPCSRKGLNKTFWRMSSHSRPLDPFKKMSAR